MLYLNHNVQKNNQLQGFGKSGDAALTTAMGPNGVIMSSSVAGPAFERSAFNGSVDSCSMSLSSSSPANYRKRSEMIVGSAAAVAAAAGAGRKTGAVAAAAGLKSIESTPSSSSGSLDRGLQVEFRICTSPNHFS